MRLLTAVFSLFLLFSVAIAVTPVSRALEASIKNNAQFISQQVPTQMISGEEYQVSVTMENTGTTTWTSEGQHKLGSQNPQDNRNWGSNRIFLQHGESVKPGEEYTFSLTVTAPLKIGTYNFQWRMIKEFVQWFGEYSPNIQVNVISGPFSDIPGPYIGDSLPIEEAESFSSEGKVLFTYYFYWYDKTTGYHTYQSPPIFYPPDGKDILTDHPVSWPSMENPEFSFRSVKWHKKQIKDMIDAGIDVFLPTYWGTPFQDGTENWWSNPGIKKVVKAMEELEAEGFDPPKIGMGYDTTSMMPEWLADHQWGVNMLSIEGKQIFYGTMRNFYSMIPPKYWAQIDDKPIVWLYTDWGLPNDQTTFDYVYQEFAKDFRGKRPYIVQNGDWNATTDNDYSWGTALFGPKTDRGVASLGPGFDNTDVSVWCEGTHWCPEYRVRNRNNGQTYRNDWETIIQSGKNLVVIETWNEFHEGSEIADSYEYGRQYIDITRGYVDKWKNLLSLLLTFEEVSNDIARDGSSYQNDGQIIGATSVTGRYGKGLYFDGVNDHAVIPDAFHLNPEKLTLTTWAKGERNQNPFAGLVFKAGGYVFQFASSGKVNPGVFVNERWCGESWVPDKVVLDDLWHHLTLTFDGTTQKYYVDGRFVAQKTGCSQETLPRNDLFIGARNQNEYFFKGVLDEIKLYSRVLSESEIKNVMFEGSPLVRLPENPIFVGQPGSWNHHPRDPFLIEHEGKYHIFYSATPDSYSGVSIGHISSTDLIHWIDEGPALSPKSLPNHMEDNVWGPWIIKEGDTFIMYYTSSDKFSGSYLPQDFRIATSTDLYTWNRYTGNPVLSSNTQTLWGLSVIKIGNIYYNYYSYYSQPQQAWQIRLATSTDGYHWQLQGDRPVIKDENQNNLESASVFEYKGKYYMIVSEVPAAENLVRLYTSDNGVDWVLENPSLFATSTSGWDHYYANAVKAIVSDDKLIVAYQAIDDRNWQNGQWAIGIAQGNIDAILNLRFNCFSQNDLNCDGKTNIFDLLGWRKLWVQRGEQADLDKNGQINIFDYFFLLRDWLE